MSAREQKLLIIFAVAGLFVHYWAITAAMDFRAKTDRQRNEARQKLTTAETFRDSREQVADEMQWLAEREPQPAANQDVQTQLQQLAENEAKSAGLTIKTQKPLPTDATEGKHYHRAKLQITVTGKEEALYRWFDRLNMPDQFRIASQIRLSPNPQDDTQIDCTATVEQWFVPSTN
jgi:hypothetical protein